MSNIRRIKLKAGSKQIKHLSVVRCRVCDKKIFNPYSIFKCQICSTSYHSNCKHLISGVLCLASSSNCCLGVPINIPESTDYKPNSIFRTISNSGNNLKYDDCLSDDSSKNPTEKINTPKPDHINENKNTNSSQNSDSETNTMVTSDITNHKNSLSEDNIILHKPKIPNLMTLKKFKIKRQNKSYLKLNNNEKNATPNPEAFLNKLRQSTRKHMQRTYNKRRPVPLNLVTTTPYNFKQFISKNTILRQTQEFVVSLLTWENPLHTIFAYLFLICLCFRPILIPFLPHFLIAGFSINKLVECSSINKSTARDDYHIDTTKHDNNKINSITNTTYLKNMQFIQNFMGQYADLHDQIQLSLDKFNWDQPKNMINLLKYTMYSILPTLLVYYLVNIKILMFLVVTLTFFAFNPLVLGASEAALFKAKKTYLELVTNSNFNKPRIIKNDESKPNKTCDTKVSQPIYDIKTNNSISIGDTFEVRILENQVKFPFFGFVRSNRVFFDRNEWTQLDGSSIESFKKSYCLKQGYEWEGCWRIDFQLKESSNDKEFRQNNKPDKYGWTYSKDGIIKGLPIHGKLAKLLTRKRVWVRTMKPMSK